MEPEALRPLIRTKLADGRLPLNSIPGELLLDAIRHFGGFASHPEKDHPTGEIIEVEPGEAKWSLDVLDTLFDFVFVQPKNAPSPSTSSRRTAVSNC